MSVNIKFFRYKKKTYVGFLVILKVYRVVEGLQLIESVEISLKKSNLKQLITGYLTEKSNQGIQKVPEPENASIWSLMMFFTI